MASDAKLEYSLEAQDKVTPKLKRVQDGFKGVEKTSISAGAKMVAFGSIASEAFLKVAGSAINLAKEMGKEADEFGEFGRTINATASEVAGLDRAFTLGGSSTEGMKSAMLSLSAALDPVKVTKQRTAVEQLGVSVKNQDGTMKSHKQLLLDIAEAYKNETSEVKKAAIGKRIFGAESQKMNDLLTQGSEALSEQIKLFGDASGYTDSLSENYASLNDAMYKVEVSAKGVLAALSNTTIFQSAVKYISDLSDEWVKFLSELDDSSRIKKSQEAMDSWNTHTEKATKAYMYRLTGVKSGAQHAFGAMADAEKEALLKGITNQQLYSSQLQGLNQARLQALAIAGDDAKKQKVVNDRYKEQLTIIYASKAERERQQKIIEESAKASVKNANAVKDETEELKKKEEAEKKRLDRLKELQEAEKKREDAMTEIRRANMTDEQREKDELRAWYEEKKAIVGNDSELQLAYKNKLKAVDDAVHEEELKRLKELQEAEKKREDAMTEIRRANMTDEQREKDELRAWYEEKKAIVGNDSELQLAYKNKLKDIEAARHQEELEHLAAIQEAERNRLETQNTIAQSTFDFLHESIDEYKSLGAVAKAVALAEAWWNTYVAYTKAIASYGPVTGQILGAIALAKGAVMTSKIQAKKYREGGIVDSVRKYGDQNYIRADGGELILNGRQQSGLYEFVKSTVGSVDKMQKKESGQRTITINVNGMYMDRKTIRKMNNALSANSSLR